MTRLALYVVAGAIVAGAAGAATAGPVRSCGPGRPGVIVTVGGQDYRLCVYPD